MPVVAHRVRRLAQLAGLLSVVAALGVVSAGCQQINYGEGNNDDDWQPPPQDPWWEDTDSGNDSPPHEDAGSSDESDESTDDGGPPKLDTPSDKPDTPCTVVDLLFVIDNSNSMSAEQANLIASFDGFIAGIQANLDEANDYHIGVVTTDAYALNDPPCQELGALVTSSAGGSCGPWTAGRFISLADELAPAFTCAANIGGNGDTDEHQLEAALRAIGPELGAPGGCNEGFIRDDALLVLIVITDEDDGAMFDQGSPGGPSDWFAQLVARKGIESNIVMLALGGLPPPNACNNAVPFEGAQITYRISQLVNKFSYGQMGDVCADDYSAFFSNALEVIHDACNNFTEG
ncbi:hypothetical protein [Enhygromyxa salina]|uniref:hypothetical protein n=1 Tax=Enhygromyxa salina TaxID=215803 RepID=UPI0011BA890F|nr:hypothetical protein [Enhygromyxa salina]